MRSKDEQKKKRQDRVNQVRGNRNLKRSKGNAREKKTGGRINEGNTNQFQWEERGDERQKSHDAEQGYHLFDIPITLSGSDSVEILLDIWLRRRRTEGQ